MLEELKELLQDPAVSGLLDQVPVIVITADESSDALQKAFSYGAASGVVEPLGALLTILLANIMVPVLPYMLAFAAGAMLYVVVEEMIPEMSEGEHSNLGTIFFALGFTLMMMLDVALG